MAVFQATDIDLGRNSYDIKAVRSGFRQSFISLVEAQSDWDSGMFDKTRSILEVVIFPNDKLFRHRLRFPVRLPGNSELKQTEWWKEVHRYFNLPIACSRRAGQLPKCLLSQIQDDLDQRVKGGARQCVRKASEEAIKSRRMKRTREDEEGGVHPGMRLRFKVMRGYEEGARGRTEGAGRQLNAAAPISATREIEQWE